MNIAKKVRVTAFAIIVGLSVLSYIMLGGVSLAKAENNEPPANSEFTAEIDTTKKGTNQVWDADATGVINGNAFDHELSNVFNGQSTDIYLNMSVDCSAYYTAVFGIGFWAGTGTPKITLSKLDGTEVKSGIEVQSYQYAPSFSGNTTEVRIVLADFADEHGMVAGIRIIPSDLPTDGNYSGHMLIDNFTCAVKPAAGAIDYTASGVSKAQNDAWKDAFDYEKIGVQNETELELKFYEPIDVSKYCSATFYIHAWTSYDSQMQFKKADGTSVETFTVSGGYNTKKSEITLRLSDYAAEGEVASVKLQLAAMDAVMFTDFICDPIPSEPTGKISAVLSGLEPAHTVSAWSEVYDYEKMNVNGTAVTLEFYEPIDTNTYKYAELSMQIWAPTKWYPVTVSANGKDIEIYTIADERETGGHLPELDNKTGIILTDLTDGGGTIDKITLTMPSDCGTYIDGNGSEVQREIHLLLTDLTLRAEAPAISESTMGDIDYKRSGLAKTSVGPVVEFWNELCEYQAYVKKGEKVKIVFAEPLDANIYEYAAFNALLWGLPRFVDVEVTSDSGSVMLSIRSDEGPALDYIDPKNIFMRLPLGELKGADGKIKELTFDFANVSADWKEFSGYFLCDNFECANMIIGNAENAKDISALMPIGASKTFTAADSGAEGTWTRQATVRSEAYDTVAFRLNATYTEHFKVGMLVRNLRLSDTISKSGKFDGAFIELSDTYASVSIWENGVLISMRKDGNFFASGENVSVKLEILDRTLAGRSCGSLLRITVGGTTFDDLYFDRDETMFGYYTHILTANGMGAFAVTVGSDAESPISEADVMNVKLTAAVTDGATKRVPLKFTYNDVANTQVNAPTVIGAAHYDAVAGYIVFDGEGEVTVKYSVSNEFGTFESNTLTLSYAEPAEKTEVPQSKGGCKSSVGGSSIFAALTLIAVCAILLMRRKKEE